MHDRTNTTRLQRGFTLVELLVVFVIIALLVAILVVALGSALNSAKRSKTTLQLESIGQALEAFESDFQYVPPLVTPELSSATGRVGLITPRTWSQSSGDPDDLNDYYEAARYNSEYTLSVYLLGIGSLNPDESDDDGISPGGTPLHDGVAGPGFKAPGPLHAWKVQPPSGPLRHEPQLTGTSYGPYLDIGTLEGLLELDEERGLYKITDVWGNPIRYYSGWTGVRMVNRNRVRTLDEIPLELRNSEGLQAQINGADLATQLGFDDELRTAKYALLSAGESSDDYYGDDLYTPETVSTFIAPFGDQLIDSSGTTVMLPDNIADYNGLSDEHKRSFEKQVSSNLRYIK